MDSSYRAILCQKALVEVAEIQLGAIEPLIEKSLSDRAKYSALGMRVADMARTYRYFEEYEKGAKASADAEEYSTKAKKVSEELVSCRRFKKELYERIERALTLLVELLRAQSQYEMPSVLVKIEETRGRIKALDARSFMDDGGSLLRA